MLRTGFFACAFVALLPFIAQAQEPLQPEQVTVEAIPAGTPKLFIADLAIEHIVDGRVRIYDANSMKLLGMVGTGLPWPDLYPAQAGRVLYRDELHRKDHARQTLGLARGL